MGPIHLDGIRFCVVRSYLLSPICFVYISVRIAILLLLAVGFMERRAFCVDEFTRVVVRKYARIHLSLFVKFCSKYVFC